MSSHARSASRRVLVLGSQGALGALIVDQFQRLGWDTVPAGRRPSQNPAFRRVDLDEPGTFTSALHDIDVVINPVPDRGLRAEKMVLERGGAVVNVSALPAAATTQLVEHAATVEVRGMVLMNAGIAPGITNLVAADLVARHPEATEIEMVFTVAPNSTSGPAGGEFAHRGLTSRTPHRTLRVPLPAPFGPRRCLGFAEPDRGWLSPNLADRKIHTYLYSTKPLAHAALLALNATRLLSVLPRAAFRAQATSKPEDPPSAEPVAHWVAVRHNGHRLAATTITGFGDFAMAASTSVIFADTLLGHYSNGTPVVAGVYHPENLTTLTALTPPLAAAGIHLHPQPVAPAPTNITAR